MKKIIDVIAPAGGVTHKNLLDIKAFLQAYGFVANIPENILGQDLLSANTESIRTELLIKALYNEESDLIWCVRGGYGATPLISKLNSLPIPHKKKNLVGFSDITALHLFLNQHWGWHTTHGAGLRQLADKLIDEESIRCNEIILHGQVKVDQKLHPLNEAAVQADFEGELTGGNLKLLEASIGTCWEIKPQHKILMIEEVGEYTYRVARTLVHLQQAGILSEIKALILGDFSYPSHPEEKSATEEYLNQFAKTQPYPMFRAEFFGHGLRNCPWRYADAKIQNTRLKQNSIFE